MRIYVYIWSFPEIGTISEQSFYRWRTSIIDHLFGGTPIYGNLHMCIYVYPYVYIYLYIYGTCSYPTPLCAF